MVIAAVIPAAVIRAAAVVAAIVVRPVVVAAILRARLFSLALLPGLALRLRLTRLCHLARRFTVTGLFTLTGLFRLPLRLRLALLFHLARRFRLAGLLGPRLSTLWLLLPRLGLRLTRLARGRGRLRSLFRRPAVVFLLREGRRRRQNTRRGHRHWRDE